MNLWNQIETSLPPAVLETLARLGGSARAHGFGLYLVGGAVRDILLLRDCSKADLDLVVEGDAVAFAQLAAPSPDATVTTHRAFGTATLELPAGPRLDFASARTETYSRPGALPKVSPAKGIGEDLARRDFTVNAMALSLGAEDRGELIDPHGGRDDLADGMLRVLHEQSFADDPTRILRGLRFRARFGFEFEYRTNALLHAALGEYYLHRVSGARVRKEIQASLEEERRADIIKEINRLDIDSGALAPGLRLNTALIEPEDRVAAAVAALGRGSQPFEPQLWVAYLLAAAEGSSDETLESLARRLALSRRQAAPLLNQLAYSQQARAPLFDSETEPSEVEDLLAGAEDEILVLLHAADFSGEAEARIETFAMSSRGVRLEITGGDLLSFGHDPSPVFGQVLREVRRRKLEGAIKNRKQELALARKLLDMWD